MISRRSCLARISSLLLFCVALLLSFLTVPSLPSLPPLSSSSSLFLFSARGRRASASSWSWRSRSRRSALSAVSSPASSRPEQTTTPSCKPLAVVGLRENASRQRGSACVRACDEEREAEGKRGDRKWRKREREGDFAQRRASAEERRTLTHLTVPQQSKVNT